MIEDEESVFKILLATDIHLGFKERNTERGKYVLTCGF